MKRMFVLAMLAAFLLSGCGKDPKMEVTNDGGTGLGVPVSQMDGDAAQPAAPDDGEPAALPYKPGSLGHYVMANADIEAGPEVLDGLSFRPTDGQGELNRCPVSNCQHDLVKDGMQVGGWVLVDAPTEMIDKAAADFEGFKALADHLCRQLFPDVYPDEFKITGGGHSTDGGYNSFAIVSLEKGGDLDRVQYWLSFYVGEKYCYVFWYDALYFADSAEMLMLSLSAEDIQPARNRDVIFQWNAEELRNQGKYVF